LTFRFSIPCIVFCKRGCFSPVCKNNTSLSLAILPPGKLLFARLSVLLFLCFSSLSFSPSSPSLSLAIGKKIQIKKAFSFCFEVFFSYRANIKNQRDIVTEKEEKMYLCLQLFLIFSFIYGERTKAQGIAESRKGSQIGAGQGREGLDNAYAYACRVEGESTAVFPSPLCLPPNES
jgi:hypothetical protein